MGKDRLRVINFSPQQIKSILRQDEKYMVGVRLHAVYRLSLGETPRSLGKVYGVCFKTICSWVNEFNKHGVEGLKNRPRSGRPSRLSAENHDELHKIISNDSPNQHGYAADIWNGIMIADLVEKKFGVKFKKAQIYNVLHDMGFILKKGKSAKPKTD
jgi:putative transposase